MKLTVMWITAAICCLSGVTESHKILALLPVSSKSHKNSFDPLIEELSRRNHEITVVTMYPSSKSIPGVNNVILETFRKKADEMAQLAWQMSAVSPFSMIIKFGDLLEEICYDLYKDPVMAEFTKNPGKYDVILVNALFNDCYISFAGTLKIPVILVSPSFLLSDIAWVLNVPQPSSYVPFPMLPYSSNMTYVQRVVNSLLNSFWIFFRWYFMAPLSDTIAQKLFPGAPSMYDVTKNVSFVLLNSHFSLEDAKPLMPYVAEVSAMHCHPANKISEVSVIYFCS